MPIYEYDCPTHGRFEQIRSFDEFGDPADCAECGTSCERALSMPAPPQGDFGTPRPNKARYGMEKYVDERLSGKDKGGALQETIRRTGHKPATDSPEKLGLKNVGDQ